MVTSIIPINIFTLTFPKLSVYRKSCYEGPTFINFDLVLIDKGRFYQDFKIRNPFKNSNNSLLETYLLFDDFSGIVVYEVKRFFFPKMEAMSKNDVEAEACEHAQNRKHGNALTKPKR